MQKYAVRRQSLTAMLWIIEVPILLMLLSYIFMVSRLILSYEKNEIAVLQSRGGAKGQITGVYLLQAVFLSATALVLGPFLGLFFCRVIGASNGFMEFVNRKALPVALTETALCYGAVTAGVLVLTMLAAVVFSRESSIVSLKRSKSGRGNRPLWQKLFLDVICLAVALYGFYNFKNRLKVVQETGAAASDIPIDFLLYGSSTLFLLGGALLFLRVFPLLVRLIYGIGRRVWGPVLYLTLLNVSRSARQNQMISLFLIFTLSMGVFNAVAVRTLNKNDEDRIRYTVGADITLQEEWPNTGGGSVFGPGGEETAFNGPGPDIPPQAVAQLLGKLSTLGPEDVLVLSGSLPQGLPETAFPQLLEAQGAQLTQGEERYRVLGAQEVTLGGRRLFERALLERWGEV